MGSRILVIDDEDLFREDLADLLRRKGYACETAADGEEGLAAVERLDSEIVLCDLVMPGLQGIEVLERILERNPQIRVIMITAHGSLDTAVAAFRRGASDYITKPLLLEDVLQKIERLIEHNRLAQEVRALRREVSQVTPDVPLMGQSDSMKQVLESIRKVAPTRSTVLLRGESGTGKEIAARSIHATSGRTDLPFVAINCAGMPEHLLESELFGHVRGAFTGAVADREGFFELAGEGTVFLDEIASMPSSLQSKLLRVLEEKEYNRVGAAKPIALRSRLVVSTNRDLKELIAEGTFREDLYFRVAVFEIVLPPLRNRRSDIPLLTDHFVKRFNREMKRQCLGVDSEVTRRLMAHDWPGNVRELRNVVEHAMIVGCGEYLRVEDLPLDIGEGDAFGEHSNSLRDAVHAYEREHIRRALLACGGNREKTAKRLDVNPSTLYRKMAELGIGPSEDGQADDR